MNLNTLHIFIKKFLCQLRNRKTLMHLHPVQFPDLVLCFGQLHHQRLMLLPKSLHLINRSIIAFLLSQGVGFKLCHGSENDRTCDYDYQPDTSGKEGSSSKAEEGNTVPESKPSNNEVSEPGSIYTSGNIAFTVNNNTATVTAPLAKTAKTVSIPATIEINGKSVPVTTIAPNAFKGIYKKAVIKCPKAKKRHIRKSFLGRA